jgi:spore coat polysaccharide biosynthesis protein SpsF
LPSEFRIGAIIQARMDSTRLPGKSLMDIAGKPLLQYVIEGAGSCSSFGGSICVATSDRPVDDPIAEYCEDASVDVFRGSVEDVSGRLLACAQSRSLDYFARMNGDSPFVDSELIDKAGEIVRQSGEDFITNIQPRSYPYGISVELFRTDAFAQGYERMSAPDHYEHVSHFFYEHLSDFDYRNIQRKGENLSEIRMTVDTEADKLRFEKLISIADDRWDDWGLKEILNIYRTEIS